jgi:alkanesulfonate monooxygenase SsuD/methylene tetrahydromethanopterin reductase-like flavin-dependent oxidoreductase (luciferase family)
MKTNIEAACQAVGRDPSTLKRSLFVQAFVAPTRRELDALVDELAAKAKTTRSEWLAARAGTIVGTTDEAAEKFREIARAGIDHANVMFPYGRELEAVKALAQVAKER